MDSGHNAQTEVRHGERTIPQESGLPVIGWRVNTGAYLVLALIATCVMLLHIATDGRYGFHRDELQVLDDARRLAWGFVVLPPFTPFIARISLALFHTSLVGLRLFSVFAQGAAIVLTGLMARELGAKRLAQIVAASAVAIAPVPVFGAVVSQYSSFDLLWWVVIAYLLIRLLKYGNPRWWVAIGAVVGVGMLTKYSMTISVAPISVDVYRFPVVPAAP